MLHGQFQPGVGQCAGSITLKPLIQLCTCLHMVVSGPDTLLPCIQGWPKFVTNLAMVGRGSPAADDRDPAASAALVLAMLAPCSISTNLSSSSSHGATSVNVSTHYPFGSRLNVSIATPVAFSFGFRVPSWAVRAAVNGQPLAPGSNGTLHHVAIEAGRTTLAIDLPMTIRIERRYNRAAAVFRGPLLYSLDLPANISTMPYCTPLHTVTDGSTEFCSNTTYQVEQYGYQYHLRHTVTETILSVCTSLH